MEKKKKELASVDRALELIRNAIIGLPSEKCRLSNSVGKILAENVIAPISLPPFDQSAMDGYAVKHADISGEELNVSRTAAAGVSAEISVEANEAIRIFTGAKMPEDADTVIMQENVERVDSTITFSAHTISKGQNVRLRGAQINEGDIAMKKGSRLTPGAIGYLAALGIAEVEVSRLPRVAVIVTGNELKDAGEQLQPGEIYESNSVSLVAALRQLGIAEITIRKAIDDPEIIRAEIQSALEQSEVVLITGGVSVGEFDYTSEALKQLNVETIFHGVAQRPGKPLFFGTRKEKLVFGLPGNPASVLSCFYIYVIPALGALQSGKFVQLMTIELPLAQEVRKHQGLTYFLKGKIENNLAQVLAGQESFILSSFAEADCLIRIPSEVSQCDEGNHARCYILP